MGFFDQLFGTRSSYSTEKKSLSREMIQTLVSRGRINTLSANEESLVEDALEDARDGGDISLRRIEEVLRQLERSHAISMHDRKGILRQFETYFRS